MDAQTPDKPKRTRKPKEQPPQVKHLCHVHDKCSDQQSVQKDVCRDLETVKHTDGKHYCLLHLPTKEKDVDKLQQIIDERFVEVAEGIAKIEAELPEVDWKRAKAKLVYDYRYVWFPKDINFSDKTFNGDAYFISATFSGHAYFRSATFSGHADFNSATFRSSAYFNSATFSGSAYFREATFSGDVSFWSATFSGDTSFILATFEEKSQLFFVETKFNNKVEFTYTNFNGFVAFEGKNDNRVFVGNNVLLDLQNARIDDAKKISFHTVRLEPSWFVNVNASEFVFTDCKWRYADGKKWKKLDEWKETLSKGILKRIVSKMFVTVDKWMEFGSRIKVKTEIEHLRNREVSDNPHEILTKACWQLADNHEESKSLSKASMFRKFASESKRKAKSRFLQPFTLHWWYYAVSFYGESWRRALFVLILILIGFGLFYESPFASFEMIDKKPSDAQTQTANNTEPPKVYKMNYGEGFVHSLSVATFQRPEPKAYGFWTKLFVALEVILAPLQAALLALAIRRKFMR